MPGTVKDEKKQEKVDEALEETFPASDPPSYTTPRDHDRKKEPTSTARENAEKARPKPGS